jgi:tetratricopeptide (TPR) repeat protein
MYDWDWEGADECYRKALKLDPENSYALDATAALAATLGKFSEAIRLQRHSIEIDPVNAGAYMQLGEYYWYTRLPDESIAALRKCLELNPQYASAHLQFGLCYLEKKELDSALTEIMKETNAIWRLYGLAISYYACGRKKDADDKLNEFVKQYQNEWAFQIAEIYAYRNEKDKAFVWLERAYNQHDTGLPYYLKGDQLMRNIVKDPRYAAFMKKMKLPL